MVKRIAARLLPLLALVPASGASADEGAPFLSFGAAADAPIGYQRMCVRGPRLCRPVRDTVPLRDDAAADPAVLVRVNDAVNRGIRRRSDRQQFGTDDYWQPAGIAGAGDCEDIAAEKHRRLLAAGFPPSRLFYAVVYRRAIGLHVVLVARLGEGDVVLDSLSSRVRPWSDARYRWVRLQTPDGGWSVPAGRMPAGGIVGSVAAN